MSVISNKLKENQVKFHKYKTKEFNNLKIGFLDKIKLFFTPNKLSESIKKKIMIRKSIKKKFQNQVDLLQILSKLQEIDKLKLILLDEDQLILFNYLAKPILYFDENKMEEEEMDCSAKMAIYLKDCQEKSCEITKIFEKMVEKEKISDVDKRLLNFIHEEI